MIKVVGTGHRWVEGRYYPPHCGLWETVWHTVVRYLQRLKDTGEEVEIISVMEAKTTQRRLATVVTKRIAICHI